MARRVLGLLALSICCTCGGSTSSEGSGGASGTAGNPASGGSSGVPTGGTGGGGSSGMSGASGAGTAGAGACSGLSYCDCQASSACMPVTEDCFCPCGLEPCAPDCDCFCAGGAYLGCSMLGGDPLQKFIGTWLIGWSGGMNHYSWLRIQPDNVARVLDGSALSGNLPFWPCNGLLNWHLAAKPDTIAIYLPGGCSPTFVPLTFSNLAPATGYPKGATLSASVEVSDTQVVEAYKFPHAQCDAELTSCVDPLL
jgi:hypothetical protein